VGLALSNGRLWMYRLAVSLVVKLFGFFMLFTEVLAFHVTPVFGFLDQLQLITNHANEFAN